MWHTLRSLAGPLKPCSTQLCMICKPRFWVVQELVPCWWWNGGEIHSWSDDLDAWCKTELGQISCCHCMLMLSFLVAAPQTGEILPIRWDLPKNHVLPRFGTHYYRDLADEINPHNVDTGQYYYCTCDEKLKYWRRARISSHDASSWDQLYCGSIRSARDSFWISKRDHFYIREARSNCGFTSHHGCCTPDCGGGQDQQLGQPR